MDSEEMTETLLAHAEDSKAGGTWYMFASTRGVITRLPMYEMLYVASSGQAYAMPTVDLYGQGKVQEANAVVIKHALAAETAKADEQELIDVLVPYWEYREKLTEVAKQIAATAVSGTDDASGLTGQYV